MDVIRRLVAEWYPDERSLGTRVTGMVAECVLAALVITATFVTTERPVRDRQSLPIFELVLCIALGVLLVVHLARWCVLDVDTRRAVIGDRRWLRVTVGAFLVVVAVAAVSLGFHDHAVRVNDAVVTHPPGWLFTVPLVQSALTVLVALALVTAIPRSGLLRALWRASVVLALATACDIVREYDTGNYYGWRVATRLGGAATIHIVYLLGIGAMIEALLHGWRRWISVPVLTILLVVLVLSGSRAGIVGVGLFAGMLVLWYAQRRLRTLKARAALVTTVLLAVCAAVVGMSLMRGSLVDRARVLTWRTAWQAATTDVATVLFGVGYGRLWPWLGGMTGALPLRSHAVRTTFFGACLPHAHNTVVAVFGEMGLVGLAALLVIFGVVIVVAVRAVRGPSRVLAMTILASLPGLLVDTYLIKNFPVSLLWWVAVFMLLVLEAERTADQSASS